MEAHAAYTTQLKILKQKFLIHNDFESLLLFSITAQAVCLYISHFRMDFTLHYSRSNKNNVSLNADSFGICKWELYTHLQFLNVFELCNYPFEQTCLLYYFENSTL